MATVLAAASYSRMGFSICLAVPARHGRVPGGSASHLEPGTIHVHISISNKKKGNMYQTRFILNFL